MQTTMANQTSGHHPPGGGRKPATSAEPPGTERGKSKKVDFDQMTMETLQKGGSMDEIMVMSMMSRL